MVAALLLALGLGVHSQPAPVAAYDDILPVSKIRPGMKGYGLTVFRGVRIERFDVTVVAVMKNGSFVAPGHDMILVRMTGGPMTGRQANLIRGMSGSPVYIRGKCIGAFSQGEPSTKEPLGGVTPIEDMLEAWDPKLPDKPEYAMRPDSQPQRGNAVRLAAPIRVGSRVIRQVLFDAPESHPKAPPDVLVLRPCTTMVTVSHIPPRMRARLRELLEPYGVEVAQSVGGGQTARFAGASLQPGAAFSVMLLSGDIASGATGTVTYRRGNRLLGFGHPFLGIGALRAPLCAAYVHDVYPLNAGSYKITTPGPVLGSLLQDRPFAVSGVTASLPDTVPISVAVEDKTTGRSKTYRMQAVNHPRLTPGLVTLAVGSAVADLHTSADPVMLSVETSVEAEEVGTITYRNVAYSAGMPELTVSSDLDQLIQILTANPFKSLRLTRIAVQATIEPGRRTATIEQVSVPAASYKPGDAVPVFVVIKPFGKPSETHTATLRLPEQCPAGQLALTVQGGAAPPPVSVGGIVFRPAAPSQPDRAPPANVQQMIQQFLQREKSNEVALTLALPTSSVAVEGEPLRGLPPALDSVLRSKRYSSVKTDRDEVRCVLPTKWVVSGRHVLTINVEKRGQPATAAASAGGTLSAQPSTLSLPAGGSFLLDQTMWSGQTADEQLQTQVWTGPVANRTQSPPRQGAQSQPQQADRAASPTAPSSASSEVMPKPVSRTVRIWRHSTHKDWTSAEMNGVRMNSREAVQMTLQFTLRCSLPQPVVWCLLPDEAGGVYAGTGPSACVFHVSADGTSQLLAQLPEVSVHALARLTDGSLIAGTGPHGRTYRISADGTSRLFHETSEPYVLALWVCKDGSVLIGTGGGEGSVYRVRSDGGAEVLADNLDQHVHSVCEADGAVYVGTSGRGCLACWDDKAGWKTLTEVPGQSFTSVRPLPNGGVLASTSPSPAVYRVAPGGIVQRLFEITGSGFLALIPTDENSFVAVGGSQVLVGQLDGTHAPADVSPTTEALCVARGADGRLWIGTANAGAVQCTDKPDAARSGTLTSSVLDAGAPSLWGRITVAADVPEGAALRIETRSGASSIPDASWSPWAAPSHGSEHGRIQSPAARYLQYRLQLGASPSHTSPVVRSVTVSYLPENRPPTITLETPAGGEHWSGKQTLKWQASDPDQDTLTYEVEISADGGATYQPVPEAALVSTSPRPAESPKTSSPTQPTKPPTGIRTPITVEQVTAELDRHPDLPRALREEILERARKVAAERQQPAAADEKQPARSMRETSRALDTTKLTDGTYLLRVRASDAPSNWANARSVLSAAREVLICNTPPVVLILRQSQKLGPDRSLQIEMIATQAVAYVSGAQWRIDEGDWTAAAPADGIADSPFERFLVHTGQLRAGKHKLEVQVFNSASLSAVEILEFEVP